MPVSWSLMQLARFEIVLVTNKQSIKCPDSILSQVTYKNLSTWYTELRQYRPAIPTLLGANKIDENMEVTTKNFGFATKNNLPLYYVSAANGTNVVKLFR